MVYFVSGVDTDAGKSIATGWLARKLMARGTRVATVKLVQTGNLGASEDIARHRAMMGTELPEDAQGLTAPQLFPYPCSPHLAARLAGGRVEPARMLEAVRTLAERYETVLVEGAGGLAVPLTEELLTIDFVQAQGWPVIFVTGGVLGSINHSLLAFEALKRRGMTVAQILYNRYPGRKDPLIDNESCAYLRAAAARCFPQAAWEELPILTELHAPAVGEAPRADAAPTAAAPASASPAASAPGARAAVPSFPANLLLAGQPALVVGGGRVGLRKTRALLEAGAAVKLVCPEALAEFAELGVMRVARRFDAADVVGAKVVFACTDDRHVNRAVLEAARARGIWCCCADGHWAAGDFIVPASFRTADVQVAVSTGGRSCRTAKEVKETLARTLTRCSPGVLFIHGVEHAAPLPPEAELSKRLAFLTGLYGWCFLRTCNRTELLAWCAPELVESGLLRHALHFPEGAYALSGPAAERHLAMVLAGMQARMVGEFHVVGQVREAFERAREAGWACGALLQAYARALKASQFVRAAVSELIPHVEVEALALEGARGRVVIAGTGALGRAAAAQAQTQGLDVTFLYHTRPVPGADCQPLSAWREALVGADRFLAALSVREPCFEAADLPCPAYDLGAPRNIRGDDGVLTLDDLRGDYLRRTGALDRIAARAEAAYQEFCHG